jgi:hypothetical protein
MLRKMKAKVGEAISPRERERSEITKAATAPFETIEALDGANLQPAVVLIKRRPSVTIMEEWNEYDGVARGGGGRSSRRGGAVRRLGGSHHGESERRVLSEPEPEMGEFGEPEEQQEEEDDDDDGSWDESFIMVDVGSEKEVATRLTEHGGIVPGMDELFDGQSLIYHDDGEETRNGAAVEHMAATGGSEAHNTSADGDDEEEEDGDDESDSDTDATTGDEGSPASITRRPKPRFKLLIPQRKEPGMHTLPAATALHAHPHLPRGLVLLLSLTTQHTPRRTAFSKCTPAALARVVTTRARALTWVRGHTRCTPGSCTQCTRTS